MHVAMFTSSSVGCARGQWLGCQTQSKNINFSRVSLRKDITMDSNGSHQNPLDLLHDIFYISWRPLNPRGAWENYSNEHYFGHKFGQFYEFIMLPFLSDLPQILIETVVLKWTLSSLVITTLFYLRTFLWIPFQVIINDSHNNVGDTL